MAPLQERLCLICVHAFIGLGMISRSQMVLSGMEEGTKSDSSRKHMKSSSFGIQYGRWNLKLRGSAE